MRSQPPPLNGRVLVVGSTMIDLIAYCDTFPDDGETLVGRSFEQGFGGKGANQAIMAARLGGTVQFVGRVGDDHYGAETISNLASQGVDVAGIAVTPGMASGMAPIWVDHSATNRILVIPGANDALEAADIEAVVAGIGTVDVVLAQLETGQAATVVAFEWARRTGATTILNPAPARDLIPDLAGLIDWMVPNETEFARLWGAPPTESTVAAAASSWGCAVAVTLGAAGVMVCEGPTAISVSALTVDPVDTTGAGDAFVGAFALAIASGWQTLEGIELAVVCGGLSTTQPGTQRSFPTQAVVVDVLEGRHGRKEGT